MPSTNDLSDADTVFSLTLSEAMELCGEIKTESDVSEDESMSDMETDEICGTASDTGMRYRKDTGINTATGTDVKHKDTGNSTGLAYQGTANTGAILTGSSDNSSEISQGIPKTVIALNVNAEQPDGIDMMIRPPNKSWDHLHETTRMLSQRNTKRFTQYLRKQGELRNIGDIAKPELDELLANFFRQLTKANGECFEPTTYFAFHRSIARFLNTTIHDPAFSKTRAAIKEKARVAMEEGLGNVPNKSKAVSKEDEERLWATNQIGAQSPMALVRAMWFFVSKLMGHHGSGPCRKLTWGDVIESSDANGRFLELRANISTLFIVAPRVYENKTNPSRCPVELYRLYKSRRPRSMLNDEDPLFLALYPAAKYTNEGVRDSPWYKKTAMGKNTICAFMKTMARGAGLQGRYTNHSVKKATYIKLVQDGCLATMGIHKAVKPSVIPGFGHNAVTGEGMDQREVAETQQVQATEQAVQIVPEATEGATESNVGAQAVSAATPGNATHQTVRIVPQTNAAMASQSYTNSQAGDTETQPSSAMATDSNAISPKSTSQTTQFSGASAAQSRAILQSIYRATQDCVNKMSTPKATASSDAPQSETTAAKPSFTLQLVPQVMPSNTDMLSGTGLETNTKRVTLQLVATPVVKSPATVSMATNTLATKDPAIQCKAAHSFPTQPTGTQFPTTQPIATSYMSTHDFSTQSTTQSPIATQSMASKSLKIKSVTTNTPATESAVTGTVATDSLATHSLKEEALATQPLAKHSLATQSLVTKAHATQACEAVVSKPKTRSKKKVKASKRKQSRTSKY